MTTLRYFLLVSCTIFTITLIWVQLVLENVAKVFRYPEVFPKTSRLTKELKYILLWTDRDYAPFYYFQHGQHAFIKNNCSITNCYVTSDRKFFNGDLTKFDAIAFNGRNLRRFGFPKHRSPHQKYIFFNTESADNYPVCSSVFDGFFNWTSTYKLDSDIPFPYIIIRNNEGEVVGPKIQMQWTKNLPELEEEFDEKLSNKSKAVAWFVSVCSSRSGREKLVKKLQRALAHYGLPVDVYGSCGTLQCPREKKDTCNLLLERDYYFYLSLENSLADDYVTEKLLTALQHNVVPIVFGGADYNRFLPPNSYLDARKLEAPELAVIIDHLMRSPTVYRKYFRWKSQYTYSDPFEVENICAVCAALNNKEMVEKYTVYDNFRSWWNPNYTQRCWWHIL